jgi:hypothetical protein
MGETNFNVFCRGGLSKQSLGKFRTQDDNIKMNLRDTGCDV